MTNLNFYCLFFIAFLFNTAHSQAPNTDQQKIVASLTDYFKQDRENIHLHLNKSTYLTNETIWFKGYVIEKKDKLPFAGTSNVYVSLFDDTGKKIVSHLIFANNSLFEGDIDLDENLKTGKYYIQVFTNFMNNFSEDESSVYEVNIVNVSEGSYEAAEINYNDITAAFYPESGVFLQGTSNTVAINISDCSGNGIVVKNGDIVDSKGNIVTNFSTNQFGFGKFDIINTTNDSYKAVFLVNEKKVEKSLPLPAQQGIVISANNYTFPDKATIKLKTNARTIDGKNNEPFTLVIQQNDKVSFMDFSFKDKTEQLISVPNTNFSEGLNTIHLIDKNLTEYAERTIFVPSAIPKITDIKVAQARFDSIVIKGTSQLHLASLSISVLPAGASDMGKDIYSALEFDSYLSTPTKNTAYFLNDFSRRKHYELDTYLMTKKSKYKWSAMMSEKPLEKFDFDKGLTIKGTINNTLGNKENYRLQMLSLKRNLNEFTTVDSKNEFVFKNIFVLDSSMVYFSLINKKEKLADLKLYSQVLNNNRQFMKPLVIPFKTCLEKPIAKTQNNNPFPKIQHAIALDSVTLKASVKKVKLENNKTYGNTMAHGFKIDPVEAGFRDVLDFLTEHGYNVNRSPGNVTISNTYARTISGGAGSPAIFIDDQQVDDFSQLSTYRLKDIDEIFLNKRGLGTGMDGVYGTVRIYTRTDYNRGAKKNQPTSQVLQVKNGFQFYNGFSNPKYDNVTDNGFLTFGTIDWLPQVGTDAAGNFQFSIPNMEQKTVKIIIEGIATDGQIISETRTLNLQ